MNAEQAKDGELKPPHAAASREMLPSLVSNALSVATKSRQQGDSSLN